MPANQVVVVFRPVVPAQLEARHAVAQVKPLHQLELFQEVQRSVHRGWVAVPVPQGLVNFLAAERVSRLGQPLPDGPARSGQAPRCAMQVEWYAANPCFHPIPPGYGLPWGTPEEEQIPPQLVFEAERALAREQLKTQTPRYQAPPWPVPVEPAAPADDEGQEVTYLAPATDDAGDAGGAHAPSRTAAPQARAWPDPRGLSPSPSFAGVPPCVESEEPVLVHTATYSGADPRVTAALQTYAFFRDDARAGGWQSYLQRSDDFIRFCCHLHIAEMLTARGGAGETRVVWRWPAGR